MFAFLIAVCTVLLHISAPTSAKKKENFDFIINNPYANSFWKNYAKNVEAYYDRAWDEDPKNRLPINQGVIADPWQNNGWILINGWNGIGATTKKPKTPTKKPTKKPTTASTEPTSELTTTDTSTEPTTDPASEPTTDSSSEPTTDSSSEPTTDSTTVSGSTSTATTATSS